MGRKKIKIEPIQEGRNRQVTYLKRKAGLFKKAYELATLTDSQVAVIVFGHNGKLSQFCSGDIDQVLLRYTDFDGVVESKGSKDYAGINDNDDDDDDDGGDSKDWNQGGPPPGPGPSGSGSGGARGGRGGGGGGGGGGAGPSQGGRGSQSGPSGSGGPSSFGAGAKRKGGARDDGDGEASSESQDASASPSKQLSRPTTGCAQHRASLPDSLDLTSLLSQPIHQQQQHQHQSHSASPYPTNGYGSSNSAQFLPNLPPSMSMPSHLGGSGQVGQYAPASSPWSGTGYGRRSSLSTPPDHVFSAMPRPITADPHLMPMHAAPHQHHIHNQPQQLPFAQPMGLPGSNGMYGGGSGSGGMPFPPRSSSFAMPPHHNQHRPPHPHPPHIVTMLPPGANHSLSNPNSAGASSSSGTSLSRPSTDDRTASSSTAGDTPLMASSLSNNVTPSTSNDSATLGDMLAAGFLPSSSDFSSLPATGAVPNSGVAAAAAAAAAFAPVGGGPSPFPLKSMPAAALTNSNAIGVGTGAAGGAGGAGNGSILGYGSSSYHTQDPTRRQFDLQYPAASMDNKAVPATSQSFIPGQGQQQ